MKIYPILLTITLAGCGVADEGIGKFQSDRHAVLTCSQHQIDACAVTCQTCVPGGGGACTDMPVAAAGTVCRATRAAKPSVGGLSSAICDQPEVCDGVTAVCPSDVIAAPGLVCGNSIRLGPCDLPFGDRVCDDDGHCLARALPTQMCKAAGVSAICDPADYCDGSRVSCASRLALPGTDCGGGKTCDATGHCR